MKVIPFLFAAALSANVFAHNVAVLNYAKLETDSKVSKNIAEQIKVRQEKLQAEVTTLQGTVQKKVEELEKASSVLTAKALDQKKESLQKELIKMDEDLKKKAQKLEEIKNETLVKVNETIKGIAGDIAKSKKIDVVISDVAIVYSQPELDITKEVLAELDKKLPKLQINWDKK